MNEQPIALVTGANRGIGFEVCRQLAGRGGTVIVSARDLAKAAAAAAQITSYPFFSWHVAFSALVPGVPAR